MFPIRSLKLSLGLTVLLVASACNQDFVITTQTASSSDPNQPFIDPSPLPHPSAKPSVSPAPSPSPSPSPLHSPSPKPSPSPSPSVSPSSSPTPKVQDICLPEKGGVFALNSGSHVQMGGSIDVTGDTFLFGGAGFKQSGNATLTNANIYYQSNTSVIELKDMINTALMSATQQEYKMKIDQLKTAVEALMISMPAADLKGSRTFVAEAGKAINVISLNDVDLASSDALVLQGDEKSVFVIKVAGNVSFGGDLLLTADSGSSMPVQPNNVLVYVSGTGNSVAFGSGSKVHGTFLVPDRQVSFKGRGSFTGAIISGYNAVAGTNEAAIDLGGNSGGTATFNGKPFCVMQAP